jgi:hypothetical protein
MRIRILLITGLVIGITAGTIYADKVPMAERHIFLPESPADQKEEAVAAPAVTVSALEKEILFTGVLLTPNGKQAIISENVKNDKSKQKRLFKEGDQIKGMTVTEIGPNYVLMANKENTVRLNLYKGVKTRPAPAPEPVNNQPTSAKPGMSADAQSGTSKNDSKTTNANPPQGAPADKEKGSPFGGANKTVKAVQDNPGSVNPGSTGNPFADLLKSGAEQRNQSMPSNAPLPLPFNPHENP